ncbi:molybdopterin-dependent oxidoreductase, partial [bacterium]|nr:molybdopterin-dependent oxidoreductase [bacterium]
TNTAPRIDLAIRQAALSQPKLTANKRGVPDWNDKGVRAVIQTDRGPVFIATPYPTKLDKPAREAHRCLPAEMTGIALGVANALGDSALDTGSLSSEAQIFINNVAEGLRTAERPVIIAGTTLGNIALFRAAARLAAALSKETRPCGLRFVLPECNTLGSALVGGKPLSEGLGTLSDGKADTLLVLENDLYRRAPKDVVDKALAAAKNIIVLDHLQTPTTDKATVTLPAGTFAESDGTLVNHEGRAQRFFQVFSPTDPILESWRWLGRISAQTGKGTEWTNLDAVCLAASQAIPLLGPIPQAAPLSDARWLNQKIPRQSARYSGRTAMLAHINVSEGKPPEDPDTPYTFTMEGYQGHLPGSVANRYRAPGWNSVQALNKFQQEVGGELTGGTPGARLFEPPDSPTGQIEVETPERFSESSGTLLFVAMPRIYGSEELSARSTPVAQRIPEPFVALSPEDALALSLEEDATAIVRPQQGGELRLKVRITEGMARGAAGISTGLPGIPFIQLPNSGKIENA